MSMDKRTVFSSLVFLLSLLPSLHAEVDTYLNPIAGGGFREIQVGIILDMQSWEGKVAHSCIVMAISDFYGINTLYKTRVVLHTRDSYGEPLHALSAALDLLEKIKVQAIFIGPETMLPGKFLGLLGDKARVPIISFSRNAHLSEHPYVVQIAGDETTQFECISAIAESFKWKSVILVYENTDEGRDIVPTLANSLQRRNIRITQMSPISISATSDQILELLGTLKAKQTTIFIVHMSPSLASKFFLNVKKVGMMTEGHAWIVTDRTMNLLQTMSPSVIESMQGVLGFKSYIPFSEKLHNFTLRWRRKYRDEDPSFEMAELNAFGAWAYDALWALAEAVERVELGNSPNKKHYTGLNLTEQPNIEASKRGLKLRQEILKSDFTGLSGKFQLINRRLSSESFEIANVVGRGERRVGYGKSTTSYMLSAANVNLDEAVIWPGISTDTPKGWKMAKKGKKLRIAVPATSGFDALVRVYHDPITNETAVTGYCIEVFKAAVKTLKYNLQYEFIGQSFEKYNDLVDQVYFQNYDAAVGDITITANRSVFVDFTTTFSDLGSGTVACNNKKDIWVFLKPLHTDLWLTSVGFFILTGIVVWIHENPINEEFQGSGAQQIETVLWFSFSTLVFAQKEKLLSNLSRFVVTVWMFLLLILTSSYTAALTSMLTVQQIRLAARENYIGFQQNTPIGLVNITNPLVMQKSSAKEYADALSNKSVVAIIDEIPYLKILLSNFPGHYSLVASETTTSGFGFVFQKGSPFVHDISNAISELREAGTLKKLEEAWFNDRNSLAPLMPTKDGAASNPIVLSLANFGGLFIISGVASGLALMIRGVYLLREKCTKILSLRGPFWRQLILFMIKFISARKSNAISESLPT